jgi:RNA-directed DNA polymerase
VRRCQCKPVRGLRWTRALVQSARKLIAKYRLKAHKTHVFEAGRPKIVTGVAVTKRGLKVPNRRQKKIADGFIRLESSQNDTDRMGVLKKLISRVYEAGQVDPD